MRLVVILIFAFTATFTPCSFGVLEETSDSDAAKLSGPHPKGTQSGPTGENGPAQDSKVNDLKAKQQKATKGLTAALGNLAKGDEKGLDEMLGALGLSDPTGKIKADLEKKIKEGDTDGLKDRIAEKTGDQMSDQQRDEAISAVNKYFADKMLKTADGVRQARERLVGMEKKGEVPAAGSFAAALKTGAESLLSKELKDYKDAIQTVKGMSKIDATLRVYAAMKDAETAKDAEGKGFKNWGSAEKNRVAMDAVSRVIGSQLSADRQKFVAALPQSSTLRRMASDLNTGLQSNVTPTPHGKLTAQADQYMASITDSIIEQKRYTKEFHDNLAAAANGNMEAFEKLRANSAFTTEWSAYTKNRTAVVMSGIEKGADGNFTKQFTLSTYRPMSVWEEGYVPPSTPAKAKTISVDKLDDFFTAIEQQNSTATAVSGKLNLGMSLADRLPTALEQDHPLAQGETEVPIEKAAGSKGAGPTVPPVAIAAGTKAVSKTAKPAKTFVPAKDLSWLQVQMQKSGPPIQILPPSPGSQTCAPGTPCWKQQHGG
jgi:hypothetical protein